MPVAEEPRLQQSVSLLPRHLRALKWLADKNGGDNLSAIVRNLIEREMRSELGLQWVDELDRLESESA
jgi:hypothetical protein